jgi:hypothetical protein
MSEQTQDFIKVRITQRPGMTVCQHHKLSVPREDLPVVGTQISSRMTDTEGNEHWLNGRVKKVVQHFQTGNKEDSPTMVWYDVILEDDRYDDGDIDRNTGSFFMKP